MLDSREHLINVDHDKRQSLQRVVDYLKDLEPVEEAFEPSTGVSMKHYQDDGWGGDFTVTIMNRVDFPRVFDMELAVDNAESTIITFELDADNQVRFVSSFVGDQYDDPPYSSQITELAYLLAQFEQRDAYDPSDPWY